jgi:hypothetical protein
MPCASLIQHGLDRLPDARSFEQWKAMKATKRDEVKCLGFLEAFQTVRHGSIISPYTARSSR